MSYPDHVSDQSRAVIRCDSFVDSGTI